jgi:hypothetical protein
MVSLEGPRRLRLIGKSPVLKTGARKRLGVRVPQPPPKFANLRAGLERAVCVDPPPQRLFSFCGLVVKPPGG